MVASKKVAPADFARWEAGVFRLAEKPWAKPMDFHVPRVESEGERNEGSPTKTEVLGKRRRTLT